MKKKLPIAIAILTVAALLGSLLWYRQQLFEQWHLYRLNHGDPDARDAVVEWLVGIKSRHAVHPLIEILKGGVSETSILPLHYSESALVQIGGDSVPELALLTRSDEQRLRMHAVFLLGEIGAGAASASDDLVDRLENDEDYFVRSLSASALGSIGNGNEEVLVALENAASTENPEWLRDAALEALNALAADRNHHPIK